MVNRCVDEFVFEFEYLTIYALQLYFLGDVINE